MNKNKLKYLFLLWVLSFFVACTPDNDFTPTDNDKVNLQNLDSVALTPNQRFLIADGHARLDLHPELYTKEGYRVLDSRIQEEWLEFTTTSGVPLTRYFSTSDLSLVGQTITTRVSIKGTDLVSEPFSFQIVAPLPESAMLEITVPVIFHIIQTTEDIDSYGGKFERERIEVLLEKINHLFSGSSSVNPVGMNTRIRFEMAEYDPDGEALLVPGIDWVTTEQITKEMGQNLFAHFLKDQHLIWPAAHYLNIWLISDRETKISNFATVISNECHPYYVYPGTDRTESPVRSDYQELPVNHELSPKECGILYRLQDLEILNRVFSGANELSYYIGNYLGLFSTCQYQTETPGDDYCDDTIDYCGRDAYQNFNHTSYKSQGGLYFQAENIMDDPTGLHVSISPGQYERMRWVLEHCPERACWKSRFAFTGK